MKRKKIVQNGALALAVTTSKAIETTFLLVLLL